MVCGLWAAAELYAAHGHGASERDCAFSVHAKHGLCALAQAKRGLCALVQTKHGLCALARLDAPSAGAGHGFCVRCREPSSADGHESPDGMPRRVFRHVVPRMLL